MPPPTSGSHPLSLQSIRETLIRQEDTIIFALIERAQYRANDVCYQPGARAFAAIAGPSESFLESMLLETERMHARVRRYTSPDEHAFFPRALPPPSLPLLDFPALLHPCSVNLNPQILEVYLHKVLPAVTQPGDDTQHGSSVVADVAVLQAISKRVHYGLFVAESKFRAKPEEYTALIRGNDEEGIMRLLTNTAVEERVLRRVRRKAFTFGQDIEADESVLGLSEAESRCGAAEVPASAPLKLDPEAIVRLYHDFIIPLTKEAEVAYLLQRLGNTGIAFHGPVENGPCHRLAVRHFEPPPATASSGSKLIECESALGVYEAVLSNRAFLGIVLLEQADLGVLPAAKQLFAQYPLQIVAELSDAAADRAAGRTRCVVVCKRNALPPPTGRDKTMLLLGLRGRRSWSHGVWSSNERSRGHEPGCVQPSPAVLVARVFTRCSEDAAQSVFPP